jgi:hypothetical protein
MGLPLGDCIQDAANRMNVQVRGWPNVYFGTQDRLLPLRNGYSIVVEQPARQGSPSLAISVK